MDKLRNLSVSSADFNYDPNNAGGSMPGAVDVAAIMTSFAWDRHPWVWPAWSQF